MSTIIAVVDAREILDSRGNPTDRGRRRPRRRLGRPGRGAVGRLDRRPRGGRAARRRQGPLRRQGRPARPSRNVIDTIAPGARRPRRGRPGGHRRSCCSSSTGRRTRANLGANAILGVSLACAHAAAAVARPAALSLPRRRRRADPARPVVQHPQRRQARPGLDRLPGVHGHAGRRSTTFSRGAPGRRRDLRRAAGHPPRRRPRDRPGRRGRLRAVAAARTRPRSRSSCGRSRRPATGRARTSRSRSTRRRARSSSRGPASPAWPATLPARHARSRTLDSGELIDLWARLGRPLPDRLARGRPGRGRLGRLARADGARSATASSWSATTSSSPTRAFIARGIDGARGERGAHQAQPDRHADRDDRGDRPRPARRLDGHRQPPVGRDRGHDDRRPRRRDGHRPDQDRRAVALASGSPSTTGCSGSRASSAMPAAIWAGRRSAWRTGDRGGTSACCVGTASRPGASSMTRFVDRGAIVAA